MRRSAPLVLALGGAACLQTPPCEPGGLCLTATPVTLRTDDHALGSADIDGDGHLDLVSVGGSGVGLRRGRGDGSLAAPIVWSLPVEAEGLALGDLDGDGAQELVTAFPSRGSLAWLRGVVGDAAVHELDVGADVAVLLTADLDGDGVDELIASERDRGRLHLWMGASSGPAARRYVEIGGEAIALAAGDYRGDGKLELAAAIPLAGEVALFEFAPAIGLERAGTAWTSTFPQSLVAADLDEDGLDDLAVIDTLDSTLWIGVGDGVGGWQREHTWPLANTPRQVFARRGPGGQELGVVRGDGNGVTMIDPFTGAARIEAIAAGALQAVVAGDFAAGGSEELVYLHEQVSVAEELMGFRAQPLWTAPEGGPGVVAMVDLDGDEVPELVAEDLTQRTLFVFAAVGAGYEERTRYPLSGALGGLRPLARGDGGADLVWWETGDLVTQSSFGVLTYTPGAGLAEVAAQMLDQPILDIVAADRDGDGWADLVVTVELGDGSGMQALVLVKREPEAGLTIGPRLSEGEPISSVVAAQIDGIGGEDLWVIAGAHVRAVLADEAEPGPPGARVWTAPHAMLMAADLDGDAQADLVGCGPYGIEVAYGHSDGTVDLPAIMLSSDPCDRLTACDLDADGDDDLVVERRVVLGQSDAVQVLRADPDGWQAIGTFAVASSYRETATACPGQRFLQWSSTRRGGTLREVVPGPALREAKRPRGFDGPVRAADLDGDGLDDLFTHDGDALTLALADGEGGYLAARSLAMPLSAGDEVWELRAAEFDGRPGKELVVLVVSHGGKSASWMVWSLRQAELVALGRLAASAPTIGDFDGDGRDELLLKDESPRVAWVSADGLTVTRTLELDAAMFSGLHRVRAADIDGDGNDDLLAVRGSALGGIEVLRSRGDGGFEAPRPWQFEARLGYIGLGDLDGDGATDLVYAHEHTLVVAHGDGKGGMRTVSDPEMIDGAVRGLPLVDDIDGDGRAEVVVLDYDRLQVLRPGHASEASPAWRLDAPGEAIVRVQLTSEEPAWVVTGNKGAIVLTSGGGP